MAWDTFWAIFSQTHPVTLLVCRMYERDVLNLNVQITKRRLFICNLAKWQKINLQWLRHCCAFKRLAI
jgi:hypothetical protein